MAVPFRFFLGSALLSLWIPLSLKAQAREESVASEAQGETGSNQASVKFRGFKSATATEDMPNMMDDWKVSLFQLAALDTGRLDDNQPVGMFFYNFVSFNYKISDDSRIAIRPTFILESPGDSGSGGFTRNNNNWKSRWDDWYVQYSKFDLFDVGPFGTRGNFRVYAPTSERSRDNGLITRLRPEFYMETSIQRGTGIEFGFRGDYYVQSRRAVLVTNSQGIQRAQSLLEAELESYVEVNQKINSKFALRPRLTWFDEWRYGSSENNLDSRHVTQLAIALGLDWRPTESFNTLIQIANQTTYYSNRSFIRTQDFFEPNNNQLVVLSNYRF